MSAKAEEVTKCFFLCTKDITGDFSQFYQTLRKFRSYSRTDFPIFPRFLPAFWAKIENRPPRNLLFLSGLMSIQSVFDI
jgi:hypothetical protein